MCGISGYFSSDVPITQNILLDVKNLANLQEHRGPDNIGFYETENVALAHNRLSIIDLREISNQPMISSCGRYVLVYNGELYNFKTLKKRYSLEGYIFNTESDTEVILAGLILHGISEINNFNGMFAFAFFDNLKVELTIARDRFGIKPLYYFFDGSKTYFSSEIHPVAEFVKDSLTISEQSLKEYMWYGTPLNSKSFYNEIKEVPSASYVVINGNGLYLTEYYSFSILKYNNEISEIECLNKIRELLSSSVKSQLVSDVPVGIFLSGGIDSTIITGLASSYSNNLKTFSVSFDYAINNECTIAKNTASKFCTDHTEIHITANDVLKYVEKVNFHHGEPFADAANIPLYLMTSMIKDDVKVVLQGDGGDELFGGYSHYKSALHIDKLRYLKTISRFLNFISFRSPKLLRVSRYLNAVTESIDHKAHAKLLTVETEQNDPVRLLSDRIVRDLSSVDQFAYFKHLNNNCHLDFIGQLFNIDLNVQLRDVFLRKVDRSTMANSVEIRVPFLDNNLAEFMCTIPPKLKLQNTESKYLLKRAFADLLPDEVRFAKKKGFGVPYGSWLKTCLRKDFFDLINDHSISNGFNVTKLNACFTSYINGTNNDGFLLWKIYIFLKVCQSNNTFREAWLEFS